MGWLPSFLGGGQSATPLDPKLREFLDKEAPTKYTPTAAAPSQPQKAPSIPNEQQPKDEQKSLVPRESLYQDGRYAHLWKNYTPMAQIEAENATEHDKMMDVLDNFKERKVELQKVALENCAQQQEEWVNCMKHGSWEDQLQMCRHQVRRFERCYTMQQRFLRALGYGSSIGRPAHVDDDIQMHADALYQRLLAHDAEAEAAKKEGRPVPVFDPAVPGVSRKSALQPSEEQQSKWQEALDKMPAAEAAVEKAALEADWRAKSEIAAKVKGIKDKEKAEREARGEVSFGDYVTALLGKGK